MNMSLTRAVHFQLPRAARVRARLRRVLQAVWAYLVSIAEARARRHLRSRYRY